jgi:hypothetical protein
MPHEISSKNLGIFRIRHHLDPVKAMFCSPSVASPTVHEARPPAWTRDLPSLRSCTCRTLDDGLKAWRCGTSRTMGIQLAKN